MKYLSLFLYEWKHFIRNPFKLIAILLFVIACVYGLHKGANLYHKQTDEIGKIEARVNEERQNIIVDHYQSGNIKPEDRPWIDYSNPFWAVWYSSPYHFKSPSPALVYSIGQSEQYGFYKRITFWASPYDADLAEEIANPERLQTGTLDFSFALLFLAPLVLLVLLYNLKTAETEQGFLHLIEVQIPSKIAWLLSRLSFYFILMCIISVGLLFYGALLTPVFETAGNAFFQMLLYLILYILFWSVLYFLILTRSKTVLASTLQLSAVYLFFAFIIPATVHQVLSITQPPNLMTDMIDVRDQQEELYQNADSVILRKLVDLYPAIKNSVIYKDSTKIDLARNRSSSSLVNQLKKQSIASIEKENLAKNEFIQQSFWFNPVTFFQNKFNSVAETHFDDYLDYRNEIQALIDKQIGIMIEDLWQDKTIDEEKFQEYFSL